jgi:hypothetical protein
MSWIDNADKNLSEQTRFQQDNEMEAALAAKFK